MKVLISAYACSPYRGSEPGMAWGFIASIANKHDLTVITERNEFQSDIERFLEASPALKQRIRFFYVARVRRPFLEKIWPPSYYWTYKKWHRDAYLLAKHLISQENYDIVHQLNMVGFREPGFLWELGIPFVWGPIGGMGIFPWRFLGKIGIYGSIYYLGYNLYNILQMRLMRRPRKAAHAAKTALISATPENKKSVLRHWGLDSTLLSEVGLPRNPVQQISLRNSGESLRIVWTGLHIPRKALNLAIEALAKLDSDRFELYILGEGPRTDSWKKLAIKLGINKRCHFCGWLPREQALDVMATSHLMLITSLRDLTSTVTIEAMSFGLPIVCLDHCGFSDVVNEECGIKVAVTTPSRVIAGLTDAISLLEKNEFLRRSLAEGALRRAQNFGWEKKAEVLDRVYHTRLSE